MTDHPNGLRFDIYERIHLAESLAGIRELDELELIPHIQVLQDSEQVILKGNLWLTGKYSADTGEDNRTLEHFIPVEITLPLNRIQRLEDIAVEIETFDVDLLSPRSLNITGVLSLHGIGAVTAQAENGLGEEFIVAHQAERAAAEFQQQLQDTYRDQLESAYNELHEQDAEATSAEAEPELEEAEAVPVFAEAKEPVHAEENKVNEPKEENEAVKAQEEAKASPIEPLQEEKKELKIGFGKAPAAETGYQSFFKKLVHKEQVVQQEQEKETREDPTEPDSANNVRWRRLLTTDAPPEAGFKRMRLCIVQKEETIDTIAEKYKINPREIVLYNRLSGQDVAEGQVIYIP